MATLPNSGSSCTTYQDADGTLYTCDDVLYRPTYYKNEQVYEVVSDPQTTGSTAAADNDQEAEELLLTSPFMRGERVRAVQNALQIIGFDVGKIDGIYGNDTDRAVREFQEWWEIPVTGVVDPSTAEAIGEAYAWTISPETYYSEETTQSTGEETAAPAAEDAPATGDDAAAPASEDSQADGGASDTPSDDSAADSEPDDSVADTQTKDSGDAAETEAKESDTKSD